MLEKFTFTYIDIEYIILYMLLACCLVGGVKRREQKIESKSFSKLVIDKTTSDIMKAIACVFVLIGHWATNLQNSGEDLGVVVKLSQYTTANVALCWFMYFSGYGLSLKDSARVDIGAAWWKRLKKIYLPLLIVCLCAIVICAFMPDLGLERTWAGFNKNVHMMHNFNMSYIKPLIMNAFGLFDWYVSCILIFYTIFYLTQYLSRKFNANHTILLGVLMLIYNVIAFYAFGWEKAHYFRFPWIFMLGHIVAVYERNPRIVNIITMCVSLLTTLIHGKVMIFCFILAITGIISFAAISRRYYIDSKPLLFLGSISYFFYLSHQRIGYTLLAYTGLYSMLLWIVITIIISYLLVRVYRLLPISN